MFRWRQQRGRLRSRERACRSSDATSTAQRAPVLLSSSVLSCGVLWQSSWFAVSARPVAVLRELQLMPILFLLCQCFPLLLYVFGFSLPLLTYDFRNLWIGKPRMKGNDCLLVVLAIKNKSIPRAGNLGVRLAKADMI